MNDPLREYAVLVPQRFNGGGSVPPELRLYIEGMMLDRYHGFTVVPNLAGAWLSPKRERFDDPSDEYRLATADEPGLLAFAIHIGALLGQFAVYVRCPDGRVLILAVDRNRAASAA